MMPYYDKTSIGSLERTVAEEARARVAAGLQRSGFSLHEEIPASERLEVLGWILDGRRGGLIPKTARLWNLLLAFGCLAKGPVVSPHDVGVLLDHLVYILILSRAGMSCARYLYGFVSGARGANSFGPVAAERGGPSSVLFLLRSQT